MSERVKVTVVSGGPGRSLLLRWIDPETGARRFKSAKTRKRAEANQQAGLLARELSEGKYATGRNFAWFDFTVRYSQEVLPGLAPKTGKTVATVFNTVKRLLAPKRVGDLTAARLSKLAGLLREEGKSEHTIKSYLAHLKAALQWGSKTLKTGAAPEFPALPRAKTQKLMKGRPISPREFKAMLDATPAVVGEKAAPAWQEYLTALWNNGLRLRESLAVYWDRADRLCVDLSGAFPMLRIPAELQKNNTDTLWPVSPEWGDMLLAVPPDQRHGPVFPIQASIDADSVSRIVSQIGEKAGIEVNRTTKVDRKTGKPVTVVKFASAHDLRRSFGFRWADRVDTFKLQELMRHSSIETTRRYYVGRNAQNTAASLWAARDRATGQAQEVESATELTTGSPEDSKRGAPETTQALVHSGFAASTPQRTRTSNR
jgi:integrase